jgi:hypothetical protein
MYSLIAKALPQVSELRNVAHVSKTVDNQPFSVAL